MAGELDITGKQSHPGSRGSSIREITRLDQFFFADSDVTVAGTA